MTIDFVFKYGAMVLVILGVTVIGDTIGSPSWTTIVVSFIIGFFWTPVWNYVISGGRK